MNKYLYFFLFLVGCGRAVGPDIAWLATPRNLVVSPSGKYELKVVEGHDTADFWRFSILDTKDKNVVFLCDEKFYIRHTTCILWGDGDVVWVYSGDIGTYYWKKDASSNWVMTHYTHLSTDPLIPEKLVKLKPFAG